jgi:hypothetical protein
MHRGGFMLKIKKQVARITKNDNKNEIKIENSEVQLTVIYPCIPVISQVRVAVWAAVCQSATPYLYPQYLFWKHCRYFRTCDNP